MKYFAKYKVVTKTSQNRLALLTEGNLIICKDMSKVMNPLDYIKSEIRGLNEIQKLASKHRINIVLEALNRL